MQDNATPDVFGRPALVTRQLHYLVSLEIEQFNIIHGVRVPMPTKRFETTLAEIVEVHGEELEEKDWKKLGSLTIAEKRFIMKASWGNAIVALGPDFDIEHAGAIHFGPTRLDLVGF